MLPIDILKVDRPKKLVKGAFIERLEYFPHPMIVGEIHGELFMINLKSPCTVDEISDNAGRAIIIENIRFLVDPSSAKSLSNVRNRIGSLVFCSRKIAICAQNNNWGYAFAEIGESDVVSDGEAVCFTAWKIVTDGDDEVVTLWERTEGEAV